MARKNLYLPSGKGVRDMNRNFRATGFIVAMLIHFSLTMAYAESVCDLALKSGAFNTSDYSQTSRLLLKKHDNVCQSQYNSEAEANSAAEQGGASIGYGPFTLGASKAKQTTNGKWSIAESRFCKASAEDIDTFTNTNARTQVADMALRYWGECIKNVDTNRLYVQYALNSDGTGITGRIVRHLGGSGSMGKIIGISSPGADSQLICHIGTLQMSANKPYDIQIDKSEIAIACIKPKDKTLRIALMTTEGDQEWISMPSAVEQKQNTMDALNQAVNSLRQELETARQRTDLLELPSGTILAWYAKNGQVPQGWAICNGQNNTPDLRNRFLRGTVDFEQVGVAGGLSTHKHSVNVSLPDSKRKGSDLKWGDTPWKDGPNPVAAGAAGGNTDEKDNLPPYFQLIFIMKL